MSYFGKSVYKVPEVAREKKDGLSRNQRQLRGAGVLLGLGVVERVRVYQLDKGEGKVFFAEIPVQKHTGESK